MAALIEDASWKNLRLCASGELDLPNLRASYQGWSKTYDEDNAKMLYSGPRLTAKKLSELMPDKNKRILDVACGTGLVGKALHAEGYVNIDGVDLVQDMLDHAQETGIYSKLEICDVIGQGIPCQDVCGGSRDTSMRQEAYSQDMLRLGHKCLYERYERHTYDAIVCVGSFNQGVVTQAVFPELSRVAKKGCIILIVMREAFVYSCPDFMNGQLDTAISLLAQNGTWNYVIRERVPQYIGELSGVIFAMEVL